MCTRSLMSQHVHLKLRSTCFDCQPPAACAKRSHHGTAGQNGFSAALPSRRSDASSTAAAPLPRYSSGCSADSGVRWAVRHSDVAEVQAICRSKVGMLWAQAAGSWRCRSCACGTPCSESCAALQTCTSRTQENFTPWTEMKMSSCGNVAKRAL